MKQNKSSGFQAFLSMFGLLESQKIHYILIILALGMTIALETAGFLLIRHVVDSIMDRGVSMAFLLLWTGVFLSLALLRGFFSYIHGRGKTRVSEKITLGIRKSLYDHLQRLSFAYHDTSQSGELVQRSTSDVDTLRKFFANQIPELSQVFFQLTINLGILLLLEWRLALFSIVVVPVMGIVSTVFFYRIFDAYDAYQEVEGRMSNRIQENLSGIRVVRSFASQDREMEDFGKVNREQLKTGLRLTWWHTLYWPFGHILCGLQFSFTLLVGGFMALKGSISPGTFIAFTALVNALIWPIQEMGRTITEISKSHVSHHRIREILDQNQEDLHQGKRHEAGEIRGNLEFRNAGFFYAQGRQILKNITFNCREGEIIALLGATGSGKTTLVNLLPRFYDYQEGSIFLDGRELKEYTRHDLRRYIGIVQQEPFLFSMTVAENIAYALDRDVSLSEIKEAARAAAIHDAIMDFPQGYDTLVGEKGVSLSGGQKQRISIARTLLKNPRILILDDSTSAVDGKTEAQIKKALTALMSGRTTFVIAHRIQTLKQADTILVMDEGRIVQMGNHDELIAVDGFYKDVFKLQTQMEEELHQELLSAGIA